MALQFKRGLEANRTAFTPAEGEIIYTTDQQKVYIGDGATPGGVLVTGGGLSSVAWNDVTDKPTFSTVATSGAYTDLSGTPTLATVATSGNYSDLNGQPSIPTSLFDLGVTDGDPGQVLTTDGSGNLSFSTIVSGGTIALSGLTDVTITDPAEGEVLTYNGIGWVNGAGSSGSGLSSRAELTIATPSDINDNDTYSGSVTGYKGYLLYKIETSHAAWVRVYCSSSAQSADSTRLIGEDPLPDAGVITEIVSTGSGVTLITPGVIGFNNESPVDNLVFVTITNLSGGAATITVRLTAVEMEI